MLDFYEKKGRKIYIVIIITVMLVSTGMLFLHAYNTINNDANGIEKVSTVIEKQ